MLRCERLSSSTVSKLFFFGMSPPVGRLSRCWRCLLHVLKNDGGFMFIKSKYICNDQVVSDLAAYHIYINNRFDVLW